MRCSITGKQSTKPCAACILCIQYTRAIKPYVDAFPASHTQWYSPFFHYTALPVICTRSRTYCLAPSRSRRSPCARLRRIRTGSASSQTWNCNLLTISALYLVELTLGRVRRSQWSRAPGVQDCQGTLGAGDQRAPVLCAVSADLLYVSLLRPLRKSRD